MMLYDNVKCMSLVGKSNFWSSDWRADLKNCGGLGLKAQGGGLKIQGNSLDIATLVYLSSDYDLLILTQSL